VTLVLLLAQLLSALLLLYVGLPMPGVRRKEGNLTRRGGICLGIGAISLVTSLVLVVSAALRRPLGMKQCFG